MNPKPSLTTERIPDHASFQITVDKAEAGSCDYVLSWGTLSWPSWASFLCDYPLSSFISQLCLLHHFLGKQEDSICAYDPYDRQLDSFTGGWDVPFSTEPGGICIRMIPQNPGHGRTILVQVFNYNREDVCWDARDYHGPTPDDLPHILPEAEGILDYWEILRMILAEAKRALKEQGLMKLCKEWQCDNNRLTAESFPVTQYLFMKEVLTKHIKGD